MPLSPERQAIAELVLVTGLLLHELESKYSEDQARDDQGQWTDEGGGGGGGGSDKPDGGGSAPSSAPSSSGSNVSSARAAADLRASAASSEPATTEHFKAITEASGGRLAGLDFRLKSEESIASKIDRVSRETGLSHDEAANEVTDALRYTTVFELESFVENVQVMQERMAAEGWDPYDSKWNSYFGPGSEYQGYNTVMINRSTGAVAEVQYHTAASLEAKEANHRLYEIARTSSDPELRERLALQMATTAGTVELPPGYADLVDPRP